MMGGCMWLVNPPGQHTDALSQTRISPLSESAVAPPSPPSQRTALLPP
jgi:hypothetical protein